MERIKAQSVCRRDEARLKFRGDTEDMMGSVYNMAFKLQLDADSSASFL